MSNEVQQYLDYCNNMQKPPCPAVIKTIKNIREQEPNNEMTQEEARSELIALSKSASNICINHLLDYAQFLSYQS